MNIHESVDTLIGNTPIVRLHGLESHYRLSVPLLAKLESKNPAGSAKDRVALSMIDRAEEAGLLKPGSVIIEPTSGNTGIGIASVAAPRGYRVILTMPDSMSVERRRLLSAYGAEIVLTPAALGMAGAVAEAERLADTIPLSFIPGQFENPDNPAAHYRTTGPEIFRDTDGKLSAFIATVGTGGTVSGTGRYLKEQNTAIRVIAVEPSDSPLLSKGVSGPHKIQGIGANFIPANLDRSVCDEVIAVTADESFEAARALAKKDGILCGISSGAALAAAIRYIRGLPEGSLPVVALLPDTGERYLSSGLFD